MEGTNTVLRLGAERRTRTRTCTLTLTSTLTPTLIEATPASARERAGSSGEEAAVKIDAMEKKLEEKVARDP